MKTLAILDGGTGYLKQDKWKSLPYWMEVQADLSLCWSNRSYCRFCHALAHFLIPSWNVYCGYSFDTPCWGISNEYPFGLTIMPNYAFRILSLSKKPLSQYYYYQGSDIMIHHDTITIYSLLTGFSLELPYNTQMYVFVEKYENNYMAICLTSSCGNASDFYIKHIFWKYM